MYIYIIYIIYNYIYIRQYPLKPQDHFVNNFSLIPILLTIEHNLSFLVLHIADAKTL
jgi:hypothetical protein